MRPKTAAAAAQAPLSADDVEYLKIVLKEAEAFKVDWKVVAEKIGMTRSDNATTKFQNVLKKMDCRLAKDKIMTLAEAQAITGKKKRKAVKKEDDDDDDDEKAGPAAKKAKEDKDDE